VQGDIFDNSIDLGGRNRGHNLLSRWNHQLGGGSAVELQVYYDQVERTLPALKDVLKTFDFQAQHSFKLDDGQRVVWGGGYRTTDDEFVNAPPFILRPESDTVRLANVFAQDSIALASDLTLTVGTKLEHNSLTGLEYLPSARIAWQVTPDHMLWSAVSRAVRTPSRIDRDLVAVGFTQEASDFESEKLMAYEIGYRGQPTKDTSLSVSLFMNDYSDLRVLAISRSTGLVMFDNKMEGQTYGVEMWGDYRVRPWWRLSAGFMLMQKNLDLKPGAIDAAISQHTGNDPDHQFSVRSAVDLFDNVQFDVSLRSIDDLPNPVVPSYLQLDARVAWQVTEKWELSLSGFNLLDDRHPEGGAAPFQFEIPRTVLAGARWNF
jgi:iron complex outermembrane receptor protein